ncbi:hypothetical protein T4D_1070 [Trichinella pseudospiralis]|uniref:Uncharacterized protein n=1 Tax=Trichinella pseudospiralis TaxID=6337 RepID=A0A0V1G623_TRIPS|nr:hypothetical protein T4D_1070 [Trichinella pseudospiralis]
MYRYEYYVCKFTKKLSHKIRVDFIFYMITMLEKLLIAILKIRIIHVRICKNTTFIKAYVYLINAQYFAFGNFSTAYGYFSKMSRIIT